MPNLVFGLHIWMMFMILICFHPNAKPIRNIVFCQHKNEADRDAAGNLLQLLYGKDGFDAPIQRNVKEIANVLKFQQQTQLFNGATEFSTAKHDKLLIPQQHFSQPIDHSEWLLPAMKHENKNPIIMNPVLVSQYDVLVAYPRDHPARSALPFIAEYPLEKSAQQKTKEQRPERAILPMFPGFRKREGQIEVGAPAKGSKASGRIFVEGTVAEFGHEFTVGENQIAVVVDDDAMLYTIQPTSCISCDGHWLESTPYGKDGVVTFIMGDAFTNFNHNVKGRNITIQKPSIDDCRIWPFLYDEKLGTNNQVTPSLYFSVHAVCDRGNEGAAFQYHCDRECVAKTRKYKNRRRNDDQALGC